MRSNTKNPADTGRLTYGLMLLGFSCLLVFLVLVSAGLGYIRIPMGEVARAVLLSLAACYARTLTKLESLTGLLVITWSASFTYLKMSQLWSRSDT